VNLLTLMTDAESKSINLNFEDEIINSAAVTHAGARRTPEAKAAK
jgi:NAD/NADP transhydrogenase alpha subunit